MSSAAGGISSRPLTKLSADDVTAVVLKVAGH